MLVLTRRTGEALHITDSNGKEIKIVVLGITGGQVKIGAIADLSTTVDRDEIHQRKLQERTA